MCIVLHVYQHTELFCIEFEQFQFEFEIEQFREPNFNVKYIYLSYRLVKYINYIII